MIKGILLSALMVLAGAASAATTVDPYFNVKKNTGTGKATLNLGGIVNVYPSINNLTPTITLNGETGEITGTVSGGGGSVPLADDGPNIFAKEWVAGTENSSAFNDIVGVAMSYSGQVVALADDGGELWSSSDYGLTFDPQDAVRAWRGIAVNTDGTIRTAVADGVAIRRSINSGASWANVNSARAWTAVAMSKDGVYQTAVGQGIAIYRSIDSGASFAAVGASHDYLAVAMSYDGQYQFAATDGNGVFRSDDFGATWSATNITDRQVAAIASSGSGSVVVFVEDNGYIWYSNDFGVTFGDIRMVRGSGTGAAISEDGLAISIMSSNVNISDGFLFSLNGGQTFEQSRGYSNTFNFLSDGRAAMSANGTRFVIAGGDRVYTNPTTATPGMIRVDADTDYEGRFITKSLRVNGNIALSGKIEMERYTPMSIGYDNGTSTGMSIVVGRSNVPSGDNLATSIFGHGNNGNGVAIGSGNSAIGAWATSVGHSNLAYSQGETAIGFGNNSNGTQEGQAFSFAGGYFNNNRSCTNSTLLGTLNSINSSEGGACQQAVALGYRNISVGSQDILVGADNESNSGQAIMFGIDNYAGSNGIVVGRASTATAVNAMTFGADLINSETNSIMLGTSASATVTISANGGVRLRSRSIAQLLAITPIGVGEEFYCNNCSPKKIVVSTGTAAGNFADAIGGDFQ